MNHVMATAEKVDQSLMNNPFSGLIFTITYGYIVIEKKKNAVVRSSKAAETRSFSSQFLLEANVFMET